MRLELSPQDLDLQHAGVNRKHVAFEHLNGQAQKAVQAVGQGYFMETIDKFHMIHPPAAAQETPLSIQMLKVQGEVAVSLVRQRLPVDAAQNLASELMHKVFTSPLVTNEIRALYADLLARNEAEKNA